MVLGGRQRALSPVKFADRPDGTFVAVSALTNCSRERARRRVIFVPRSKLAAAALALLEEPLRFPRQGERDRGERGSELGAHWTSRISRATGASPRRLWVSQASSVQTLSIFE
jgi:hypothetical protein